MCEQFEQKVEAEEASLTYLGQVTVCLLGLKERVGRPLCFGILRTDMYSASTKWQADARTLRALKETFELPSHAFLALKT